MSRLNQEITKRTERPSLPEELTPILADLAKIGARPFLVGGAVRDWLMGRSAKDTDIEVYGITAERLIEVLQKYGRAGQVGVSFGVIKLTTLKGKEFDFSLPRRESKSGDGHKDFIVTPDPNMTIKEACGRRDYTINAMALDLTTNELHDYYSGRQHIEDKVLRHTTIRFAEDPLRVLRGFQMAARFKMRIHPDTARLCQRIKGRFAALAKERVWGEWEKWALKVTDYNEYGGFKMGLDFLKETGWDEHFVNLRKADTYNLHRVEGSGDERLVILFSAMCRNMTLGEAEVLLTDIGVPQFLKVKILKLLGIYKTGYGTEEKAVRRMAVNLHPMTVRDMVNLLYVTEDEMAWKRSSSALRDVATKLGCLNGKPVPYVMGRNLVSAGLAEPGPVMGKVLTKVYDAQIDGKITDEASGLALAKELLAK